MDFHSIGRERREEWRRQETTAVALAALREAETTAATGVLRSAESPTGSINSVALNAGIRMGIAMAIDILTGESNDKVR